MRQEVQPADPPTTVHNIRHWVGDSHTRVVIDLSGPTPHTEGRLTNPDRVFFDLHGAAPDDELEDRAFPIEGSHLRRIRLGVPEENITRVALDFSSVREVSVFALPDPYRLAVDIHGTADSLADRFRRGVHRIVIDAGHGGKDPGTSVGSLREKDIALDIAKRARDDLESWGFEVIMTRDRDVFVPLEQRAFIANSHEADLFVSIHVNAARNRSARGLETFYLNPATSADAAKVAARENASTGMVRTADVANLLEQILKHPWKEESREFAAAIQAKLAESVLGRESHPLNRGVKTAGFHVLLGVRMPAVVVEVGFVSNREEARQLGSATHREEVATAITYGISCHAARLQPNAARRPDSSDNPDGGRKFTIQVAAFRDRADAERMLEQLAVRGIQGYIEVPAGIFRVRVGQFESREAARALAACLESEQFATLVTSR